MPRKRSLKLPPYYKKYMEMVYWQWVAEGCPEVTKDGQQMIPGMIADHFKANVTDADKAVAKKKAELVREEFLRLSPVRKKAARAGK